MWDDTDRRTVARTSNHIIRENEGLRRESAGLMPSGFVAIAENGAGDLLVVGPEADEILHLDHETGLLTEVAVRWE